MSAYSSTHWPENGHALGPFRGEATRGTSRPPNRQQDQRWYHGEAGTRTPYGGRGFRHNEAGDWNHFPGPGGTQENGYREEHYGEAPHLRPDQRYGMGYRGEVEDPRLCRRDMMGRDWGRFGDTHGSPHSFPSPHAQPSPTSHSHGSPHSFPSPHGQPSPTSHSHGSPRFFPSPHGQPSPNSYHGGPHPFSAQHAQHAQPSPTSLTHGSPHSFPSPHAQPSPTYHGSPRSFPSPHAQPSPTSHTHGSPHSFPSPTTSSPHAYSSPRAFPSTDPPPGMTPRNQPSHGSHWYNDGHQQNEWGGGGERAPMTENRGGFPAGNQFSGGKYQNDVSDLARCQRVDHRKPMLPNVATGRPPAVPGPRGVPGKPVDAYYSSSPGNPRHSTYDKPPEAMQRGRGSPVDKRGRRMYQRNNFEPGNEEKKEGSYYMPSGPRNEERRYPLQHKLQQDRLTDHHGVRKAYGYQRNDSLGPESSRDPRLNRKPSTQLAPKLPEADTNQIFTEHSYCKRNALAGSELEPVPEKSKPNLQQPSESCYLTTMAPVGAQRRRGNTIIKKDEVASSVSKASGQSLSKSANESKAAQGSNGASTPSETTAKVIQGGPSKPRENKSGSISPTRPVQNGIVPKEESTPEDDKSKLEEKHVKESKVNRGKTAQVFPNRVRTLPTTDITFSRQISLDGFELDLDTEPETSEDEAMKAEGRSLVVSLPSSHLEMPDDQQPNLWSITAAGSSKIRLSKLSGSDEITARSLKLSLKQFPSNRIQLRNGRLLPSSTLAIYASRKSRHTGGGELYSELTEDPHDVKEEEEPHFSDDSSIEMDVPSAGNPSVADNPGIPGNPGRGGKRVSLRRKRSKRGLKFIQNGRDKRKNPGSLQDSRDGGSPSKRAKTFQDFVPVVLQTRSRAETATSLRRKEMAKEIEQHDRERTQTARPEEESEDGSFVHDQDGSSVHDQDGSFIDQDSSFVDQDGSFIDQDSSFVDQDGSVQDDSSSGCSLAFTTSSSLTSRDMDSATGSNTMLEQFSPELIARCKKIATARSSGDTPLHKVCRTGKYDMVRYLLLAEGAQVNVQDYAGWTPLHEACSSGNMGVAELLLRHDADTNISSRDGTRPIHDAIENGSLDMVKLLITHGADPLAEMGDKTPVEYAMAMNQEDICKYLQDVVRERQQSRPVKTSSPLQKPTTRQSQKQKLFKHAEQAEESEVAIPVDGYSINDPKFGAELDFPLFYITPIIEMSDKQFLQVYNFEITSGSNPRRHNFHLLDDVLEELDMNESELYEHCPDIGTLEITVAEFLKRMKHPYYNKQVMVPENLQSCPKTAKIKFIPLCGELRSLLDIEMCNLDD